MEYYEGDNIGGISSLALIEHFYVKSLVPMELVTGKVWIDIPFKDETGEFEEKVIDSDNGPIYSYSGKFFIHNMREDVDTIMNPFIKQIAVAKVVDMNGRCRIIGGYDNPITISKVAATGNRYVNENGTLFSYKIDQSTEAPVI